MVVGRLFVGGNRTYFALYPNHPNLHMGVPPEIEDKLIRCANIVYRSRSAGSKKDKHSSIDLFLLEKNEYYNKVKSVLKHRLGKKLAQENLHIENITELVRNCDLETKRNQKTADKKYGVVYRIKKEFFSLQEEIVKLARADVVQFFKVRTEPLKQDNTSKILCLEEILFPTRMKKLKPAIITRGTKSQVHSFCYQDLAIDFTRGCKSYELEIPLSKGEKANVFNPWYGCTYCYNRWVNIHHFSYGYRYADKEKLIDQIKKFKEDEFNNQKIHALRIGEGTECFTPKLIAEVLTTIEAAHEENIPVIIPTKTPFYDKEVAKVLKECNVSLMISLGLDEFEIGVCKQGFTNKERIELAKKYHSAGVRTILYPLTDLTTHPEKQKLDSTIEAYRLNQREGMLLQFLLFRTNSKEILARVSDTPAVRTYDPKQIGIEPFQNVYYLNRRENTFFPAKMHPFFLGLMEKNDPKLGVCSVVPEYSACSTCFVPGLERKFGPQKKKRLPTAEKKLKDQEKRRKKRQEKIYDENHRFQRKLFKK